MLRAFAVTSPSGVASAFVGDIEGAGIGSEGTGGTTEDLLPFRGAVLMRFRGEADFVGDDGWL